MSYHSDFTISTPRKKSERDKTIDDDEFERFLNDSSTSDIPAKYKKKRNTNHEPWWMNSDDNKNTNASVTKSFIKQPKSKLTTPLEIDEVDDIITSPKVQNPIDSTDTKKSSIFESESFKDKQDSYPVKPKERKRSKQSVSLLEDLDSTVTMTEKNYDDEVYINKNNSNNNDEVNYVIQSEDEESKLKFSSRLDYNYDGYEDKSKLFDEDDDLSAILRESQYNINRLNEIENNKKNYIKTSLDENINVIDDIKDVQPLDTATAQSTAKADHLLSKVIFLDSMESAYDKDTLKEIKKIQDKVEEEEAKAAQEKQIIEQIKQQQQQQQQQQTINKKNLKVKINEDHIERRIHNDYESSQSDQQENSDLTFSIEIKNDDDPVKELTTRINTNDTQTRSDLEQLEKFYLKNLQIESNAAFNSTSNNYITPDPVIALTGGKNTNLIESITNELEERALHDILNDLKINSGDNRKPKTTLTNKNTKNLASKPPKKQNGFKYNYVKSSGYGKSNWLSNENENNNNNSVNEEKAIDYLNNYNFSDDRPILKNNENSGNDIDYLMEQISSLMKEREKDRNLLMRLRDEFVEREHEYKLNIESLKKQHESTEKEMKKQISHLTSQLIEKQKQLKIHEIEAKSAQNDNFNKNDAEKKFNQQEQLLNGYQNENERLYTELKQLKDNVKFHQQQNEMDNQKLKIELINKNIQIDNLKQQLTQQPRLNNEARVSPRVVDDDEVQRNRIKQLETEKNELTKEIDSLKQKFEKYEESQLKNKLNANKVIEGQRVEIKNLEEQMKILEKKTKPKLNERQNIKKIHDDYEVKLANLEGFNRTLMHSIDEFKANEVFLNEKIKQLDNQLKFTELKKHYDSSAFKEPKIISNIQLEEENDTLRNENHKLKQNLNDLNLKFDKNSKEHEINMNQLKNHFNLQIQSLKQMHKNDVENQLNEIIAKTQQLNELKLKNDEQKCLILKLKENLINLEDLKDLNETNESEIVRLNNDILKLKNELHLARLHHSPKMKHFDILNEKLNSIENKYSKREKELQDILNNNNKKFIMNSNSAGSGLDIDSSSNQNIMEIVRNYQKIIESKDRELLKFRSELDSMLELLQTLQNLHK